MTANWYRKNQSTASDLTYRTVKNSNNFTIYIFRKLCLIYFLQLSIACNITAPFSLHPYIFTAKLLAVAILGTFYVLLLRLESPLPNTNANSDFVQQEPITSCNISPTPINNYAQLMWHTDTNQNPTTKLPISLSSTLEKKTRNFHRTNLNPYLPKMFQSKNTLYKLYALPVRVRSTREDMHYP